MRRIVALLQARTDSTRLPNKVLKNILNKPMIIHELERIQRSNRINELILLTSDDANDDQLVNVVEERGFSVFRGSKNNVLDRFYQCSKSLGLDNNDVIIRLTGDCPLHDAGIIDDLINEFLKSNLDYMANCIEPLYPDGLDAEVFLFTALCQAHDKAEKLSEKEHVTPYIRDCGLLKVGNQQGTTIHPEWRLTVDEPGDFIVVENIFNHFGSNDFQFSDMISFIESHPSVIELNNTIQRNEGYLKSLLEDDIKH